MWNRLRPFDIALLTIIIPLWLLCFVLHMLNAIHGELARVPVLVTAPPHAEAYPVVRGFRRGTEQDNRALAIGDTLLSVGEEDLQGVGVLDFIAKAYAAADGQLQVPVAVPYKGTISLNLSPSSSRWSMLFLTLGFALIGTIVLLRRPGLRSVRAFFLACIFFSFHWTIFYGGSLIQTYAWMAVFSVSAFLMFPLVLRAILSFPEEAVLPNEQLPWWPWFFVIFGPITTSARFGVPSFSPSPVFFANYFVTALFVLTLLTVLTGNYRQATPLGRRQLRWVIYGFYIGVLPVLLVDILALYEPTVWRFHDLATTALVLVPVCMFIAIIRFNLFDIDRLISVTAAYSIIIALLSAGSLAIAPILAQTANAAVGIPLTSGQTVFFFLLATLAVPGQRYLHPLIEQWVFPERYALTRGVQELLQQLPTYKNEILALTITGERLQTLLRPESCIVYKHNGDLYTPVFVRGGVAPPQIPVATPFVDALQSLHNLLDMEEWKQRARVYLSTTDRAILERLRSAVIVSLSEHTPPAYFLCLGKKISGDIYTTTDFALLLKLRQALANRARPGSEMELSQDGQMLPAPTR